MSQLILQNIRKHTAQTISIVVSVAISAAVIFALVLVFNGVNQGIDLSRERLGADIIVVPNEAYESVSEEDLLFTGAAVPYYMPESAADDIASVKWVERVTPQFFCQTLSQSQCCTTGLEARVLGVDPETDWAITPWMQEDIGGELSDSEIVVGSGIVQTGTEELKVLNRTFKVASTLDYTGTSLDYSIIMDIDVARELAASNENFSHLWEKNGDPGNLATAFLVNVDDGIDDTQLTTLMSMIEYKSGGKAVSASGALADIQGQMHVVFVLMFGAAILLAIASIIQLIARFYSMTWDRRAEFGLYRALGGRKKTLRSLISGEMLVLVGGGSVIGVVAGYGLFRFVLAFLTGMETFPFVNPSVLLMLGTAIAVIVALLVIGFLSILVPMSQINKISPTIAMVRGNID